MASAGLAGVYAGSTYSVNEAFQPETGAEISADLEDETTKFLVGYYADANLQFDATERTGFYVGAVYQATGSYDQEIATANANYVSNVDLNGLNGFRAGLTYKF
jgi:opacity protein-like surface antigen